MAKIDLYGAFPQVDNAIELLLLMADPKGRDKILKTLKGLEAERDKLNEAIETYGKAREIDSLHAQAKELTERAAAEMEVAEVTAAGLKAQAEAADLKAAARAAELDRLESQLRDRRQDLDRRDKQAQTKDKALTDALDAGIAAREEASAEHKAAMAKVTALRAELETKIDAVKKAAA